MRAAGFKLEHTYPTGTELFMAPRADGTRTLMPGTPWPVNVWYDAPTSKVTLRGLGTDSNESFIMTFAGQVAHKSANIMVDSGASCAGSAMGFITQAAATQRGLQIGNSAILWANLASGASSPIKGEVKATLRMGRYKAKNLKLLVLANGVAGVDVILGTDWLKANGATLCWATDTMNIKYNHGDLLLKPEYTRSPGYTSKNEWDAYHYKATLSYATAVLHAATTPDLLSATQAHRLLKKGVRAFMVLVRPEEKIFEAHATTLAGINAGTASENEAPHLVPQDKLNVLLDKYQKNFEPLGHFDTLQQTTGVGGEHLIKLEPKESYKGVGRMYRLSPKEMEELKKQVAHLIDLWYD